jgi:hypothetical protein
VSLPTVSGVAATRCSPGVVSRATSSSVTGSLPTWVRGVERTRPALGCEQVVDPGPDPRRWTDRA